MFCVGGCYTKHRKQGKKLHNRDERRFAAPSLSLLSMSYWLAGHLGPGAARKQQLATKLLAAYEFHQLRSQK
jgi:hypothetical protein